MKPISPGKGQAEGYIWGGHRKTRSLPLTVFSTDGRFCCSSSYRDGAAPSPITKVFSTLPQAWFHELGRNEYLNGRFSVSEGVATRGVGRQDSKLIEAGLR